MNKHHGSTLDDLLDELGERQEVEALAAKRILAVQAQRRMTELGLTKTKLAQNMHTSRSQVLRVLDGDDAGITLKMLFAFAGALALPLVLEFGAPKPAHQRPAAKRSKSSATGSGSL